MGQNGACTCQGELSGHLFNKCTTLLEKLTMHQDVGVSFTQPEKNGRTETDGMVGPNEVGM
jgi:hypothetical protein